MFKTKLTRWSRLDNAAKIFPATSGKKDVRVFRFACELTEYVDPEILQQSVGSNNGIVSVISLCAKKGIILVLF